MNKRSILKKTFQFGAFTAVSRFLGLPREILQIKFLGVGALSDAFIAAFRLPNFFRRIFAEGALSAAFIPTYVQLIKHKKIKTANSTMTLAFLFFESIVLLMCIIVFFFPLTILKVVTPGFSHEQIQYAVPLIRILFPFLLFISSSALLSGALQSKNHFFAQSFGPVIHNIIYLSTIIFCLLYEQSVYTLALGILLGGVLSFMLHVFLYFKHHFTFGAITREARGEFCKIITKFIPCLLGVGIVEINLYLDNVISSFLPKGSYTLLYVSNRFLHFPLGIFAVAFSTILLPHFSRITTYATSRLHYYLLETAKFITWIIAPTMLFIYFVSEHIFTLMLPDMARVPESIAILTCYVSGLLFFCFNKVLINMFYSLHDTWSPTVASIIATVVNLIFNIIGMYFFGAPGIAASTAISGLALTITCLVLLRKQHRFRLYWASYILFLWRYLIRLVCGIFLFLSIHTCYRVLLTNTRFYSWFYVGWGYWLFTIPLFLFTIVFLFLIRNKGKTKVYFLTQ